MRDAWWPGLEGRLERQRADDEARTERQRIEGGWHLPRWLTSRGSTPYGVRIAGAVVFLLLGMALGRVAGAEDGWTVAWCGLLSAQLGAILTDAWYFVGARRFRRLEGRRAATKRAEGLATGPAAADERERLRADRPR
jgi:hypothetical protein